MGKGGCVLCIVLQQQQTNVSRQATLLLCILLEQQLSVMVTFPPWRHPVDTWEGPQFSLDLFSGHSWTWYT